MMTLRIGIVGVGEIAEAIVEGLNATPNPPPIQLSPRGAGTAGTLADKHSNVIICPDNQTVVDRSDLVLLTVGPADVETALRALHFPSDRTLVSAVAGWSLRALREHLPDLPDVVRVIPLPAVRDHLGVTAIFPRNPPTETLFSLLGETLLADDEAQFSAFSVATASISSHLTYLATIASWLVKQNVAEASAERFIRSVYLGIGQSLCHADQPLLNLVRKHETPGGINEELRRRWFDSENQALLVHALDRIRERVSPPPAGQP
jgi:pyrroline-5-carboxylate reductase